MDHDTLDCACHAIAALPFAAVEFRLDEPDALWCVGANEQATRWLGQAPAALMHRRLEDTLPMLAGIGLVQRLRLVARSGKPMPFDEVTHDDRSIEQAYQVWAMSLRPDHVIVAVREVPGMASSPRPAGEAERERRLKLLFDLVPEPVAVIDRSSTRFIDVNPAWCGCFGYSREEALGRTSLELDLWVDPQQRQRVGELTVRDLRVQSMPLSLRRRDGAVLEVEFSLVVARAREGSYVVWMVHDRTVQRRAEREIAELARHLQDLNHTLEQRVAQRTQALAEAAQELGRAERLAALGRLVAGIAHELNTPIGNSLLAASTLADQTRALQAGLVQGIRRSALDGYLNDTAAHCALLVRNLERAAELISSFKQVAVDRTSAHRRAFGVGELVAENLLMLKPAFTGRALQVVEDIDTALSMDSYPGPLGQVLTNLIDNALRHGFAGGDGTLRIEARSAAADEVLLRVCDDGCGIAPEHLGAVFDPFFTTALGRGGTGLGLHLVHSLVHGVLGGRVEVTSTPGQGTCFTLWLPRVAPRLPAAPPGEADGGGDGGRGSLP